LIRHPPADGTEEVSEVGIAGGLDAREDSAHPLMVFPPSRASRGYSRARQGPPVVLAACPTR
jgi:hypothetical protein